MDNNFPKEMKSVSKVIDGTLHMSTRSHNQNKVKQESEAVNEDTIATDVIPYECLSSSSTYAPNYTEIDIILQKKSISKYEKYLILTSDCKPPDTFIYPFSSHISGGIIKRRYLLKEHLELFDWLVYSSKLGGLICKYCWLFRHIRNKYYAKKLRRLIFKPLTDYSRLLGKGSELIHHNEHDLHNNYFDIAQKFIQKFERKNRIFRKEVNEDEVNELGPKNKDINEQSFSSEEKREEQNVLRDSIMKNVGCEKLSFCLELCGCETGFDVRSLNENNIHDIENYVSIACQGMEVEDRKKYLRGEFVNNPEKFFFNPFIKTRLFATLESIADDLDKSKTDEESQEEIKASGTCLQKDNVHEPSENSKFSITYRGKILDYLSECRDYDYDFIIKKSDKEFKDCHLVRNRDFTIYKDSSEYNRGYFCCHLCASPGAKYRVVTFMFLYSGNVDFKLIKSHLFLHFQFLEKSLRRKGSTVEGIDVKRGRISHEGINDKLSLESKTIDFSTLKTESQTPIIINESEGILTYKGENLSECADHYYIGIIKESELNFKDCHLVRNEHFSVYQDNKDPSKGYFCCKLCLNLYNKNVIIKFTSFKNKRNNFLPIKNHLNIHFSNIRETKLKLSKSEESEESD